VNVLPPTTASSSSCCAAVYVRFGTVDELAPGRPKAATHTIAQLWVQIARAAEQGYAVVDEEFEDGLVGVSAPIRDFRGRVIAAINISAPKDRFGARCTKAARSPRAPRHRCPRSSAGNRARHRQASQRSADRVASSATSVPSSAAALLPNTLHF
jgi:hypothetical protein